ncbi:MAG: DUF456 family protein [Planctomycetales bacterium]
MYPYYHGGPLCRLTREHTAPDALSCGKPKQRLLIPTPIRHNHRMGPYIWYYTWGVLLVLGNAAGLLATAFALPGNWVIVALTALFAWLVQDPSGGGVSWSCVVAVTVLAVVGEIVEFVAGAAGAARSGGSRRGILLSIVGAMLGSIAGAVIGVPIPLIGSLIAAVGGGALGAFAGAYLGETWKGRSEEERVVIGRAALVGRLLGTVGKLGMGGVMFAISTVDVFFF